MLEMTPWLMPLSDGLVLCKDGMMLACFEFEGLDCDGAPDSARAELAAAVDRFFEVFRDRPVTVWWTAHRMQTAEYPEGRFESPVAQMLDDENRATFLDSGNYTNRHYFSVGWMPPTGASGVFDRISSYIESGVSPFRAVVEGVKASVVNRNSFAFRAAEIDQAVQDFEPLLDRAESALFMNHPRRLRGKDLLGFLWATANPGKPCVPKAWDGRSLLDGYLPEMPVQVYAETLAFGDAGDRRYAAAISLKTLPESTSFGAFLGLLSAPSELTLSVCFRITNTRDAEKHIEALKRINEVSRYPITAWIAGAVRGGNMTEDRADPAKTEAIAELLEARGEMTSGRLLFGESNSTIVIYDSDGERLNAVTRETLRSMHASEFVGAVRETIHLLSAWSTTLPGSWQECNRWLMLPSTCCGDFAPLVGVSDGEPQNDHLTRQMGSPQPALTALATDYLTPYYLNFHSGGVGHALVLGPTGSGKSVGMNFLISQWGRYAGSRALVFDKDYSSRIPTLLQGGRHIDLKPGSAISLNPLRMSAEARHRPFLVSWIEGLISGRGYRVTTQDAQTISQALAQISARRDGGLVRLKALAAILPTHLRDELAPWIHAESGGSHGQYADYFDNEADTLDLGGSLTAIEMNDIMRIPAVARAFLDYAFYRLQLLLEGAADGSVFPTLIYIEEAWFLMQEPAFVNRLIDWLKTFRKLNASVVMATQSLEDVATMEPRILAALRDNVLTRIYLPNASAKSDSAYPMYRGGMGLTDSQIERIAKGVPREDYFVVKPGVARMVRMRLTPRQVACLRSDQRAQRTFDRYMATGRPVTAWWKDYISSLLGDSA